MKNSIEIKIIFSFLIFVIVLISCKRDGDKYFTFGQVGNQWTYELVGYSVGYSDSIVLDTVAITVTEQDGRIFTFHTKSKGWYFSQDYTEQWFIHPRRFGKHKEGITTVWLWLNSDEGDIVEEGEASSYYQMNVADIDKEVLLYNGETMVCTKLLSNSYDGGKSYYISKKYGFVEMQISYMEYEYQHLKYRLLEVNF